MTWSRRLAACLLASCLLHTSASGAARPRTDAQLLKVWIYWNDAMESEALAGSGKVKAMVSPRAIARLERERASIGLDDPTNRAVPAGIFPLLSRLGVEPRVASRSLRAISADLTPAELAAVESEPWVLRVEPRATYLRLEPTETEPALPRIEEHDLTPRETWDGEGGSRFDPRALRPEDYGPSWLQNEQIGVNRLHEHGYSGEGVLLCLLDGGSNNLHASLVSADVIAMRDFVDHDSIVRHTPGDELNSDQHGTFTWSTAGGFGRGSLVGPAYNATFALARTEYIRTETRSEEDNYVAGIEWADSLGADIVSSSLGYRDFTESGFTYAPGDLDGRTAVTTRAVAWAARRGIVVVTAAGNEGPGESTLVTPADAESALAVGSVDRFGRLAEGSSRGPTADGRVKPDLCARGVSTLCANTGGGYTTASGTSLATPLIAGLAALLRQAHPEWSAVEVMERLRASGDRAGAPDNGYGHGVPDGFFAADLPFGSLVLDGARWRDDSSSRHVRLDTSGSCVGARGFDPDTLANPGDHGRLHLRLRNAGRASSAPARVHLRSLTTRVRVDADSASVASLAPGESIWLPDSLGVAISDSAESPLLATVYLEIEGSDGGRGARRVPLLIAPASWYSLTDFSVTESRGQLLARFRLSDAIAITAYRLEREREGAPREILSDWESPEADQPLQEIRIASPRGLDGSYFLHLQIFDGLLSAVEGPVFFEEPIWSALEVRSLRPNPLPSRQSITLLLRMPGRSPVTVDLFDPSGRRVARPIDHVDSIDGGDLPAWSPPSGLSSGLYLLRIHTDFGQLDRRLVLLR